MKRTKMIGCVAAVGVMSLAFGPTATAAQKTPRTEAGAAPAAGLPVPAGGALGSFQVVTAAQIAATAAPDIKAALGLVPALVIEESGGPGGVATLSIRGSSSQQVLVLLDGHRLAGAQSSFFNLNDLPVTVERVERIEVVPHPASVLYGADALGGVVNIVTRPVGAKPGVSVSVGLGDDSERRLAGGAQYGVGKLGVRLDGQLRSGDGFRDNGDFDLKNAAASLAVAPDPWGLEVRLSTLEREAGVPGLETLPSPHARQDDGRDEVRADVIYRPGGRWDVKAGAYSQRQTLDFDDPDPADVAAATPADPIAASHENRSRGVDARMNVDTGRGELYTLGAEWVVDRIDSTSDGDHETDRWGVFVQDQWRFGSWSAVGAARRDEHSVYGDRTSLSLSGGWEAGGWKFSASWAQAYRAPNFDERYRNDEFLRGDPDLKPETSVSYEGCAEVGGGDGRVRLNVFQRKVSDLIQWADADGDSVLGAGNVARARITGWEAEALYRPSATIEIPVSYQSLSAEDEDTGERLAGSVQSLWRAGVRSATRSFTWSVDYSVTDRGRFRLGDGSWRYAVLNAGVAWRHRFSSAAVQVSARAENLRDEDYQTVEGYPLPGRSLFAEIRIEL